MRTAYENAYEIEAIVTVDGRGQVVLPKVVRDSLRLGPGSRLAVVLKRQGGMPCCVTLMPASALEDRAREVIEAPAGVHPDQSSERK